MRPAPLWRRTRLPPSTLAQILRSTDEYASVLRRHWQPTGWECGSAVDRLVHLPRVQVLPEAHDAPVPQRPHMRESSGKRAAGRAVGAAVPAERDHMLAGVEELFGRSPEAF